MSTPAIAVDAMGGDNAPGAIVEGACAAARDFGVPVLLVGPQETVAAELQRFGCASSGVAIVHASDVVAMDEHATAALRHRTETSIAVGVRLVKEGRAAAFLTAGNTGAAMAVATLTLGRQPGIERPALGTVFPSSRGRFLLLDVGANADARPVYLEQFALLGREYARRALGIGDPRVALLNIGEEPGKGSELAREAYERIARLPDVQFVGNIEGKDLTRGLADVVVTDGFTGNVAIKTAEGVAEFILRELRGTLTAKLRYKLAALVLRPALMGLRSRIDYAEYGAAPLLGLNGTVLIAHGRSDARAIRAAVRVAGEVVAAGGAGAPAVQPASRGAGKGEAS
jgi:glycerol-3-phosphate acyltransferase PlsX